VLADGHLVRDSSLDGFIGEGVQKPLKNRSLNHFKSFIKATKRETKKPKPKRDTE
jgi:hypothetical protein